MLPDLINALVSEINVPSRTRTLLPGFILSTQFFHNRLLLIYVVSRESESEFLSREMQYIYPDDGDCKFLRKFVDILYIRTDMQADTY
jgi:hypothetical protein